MATNGETDTVHFCIYYLYQSLERELVIVYTVIKETRSISVEFALFQNILFSVVTYRNRSSRTVKQRLQLRLQDNTFQQQCCYNVCSENIYKTCANKSLRTCCRHEDDGSHFSLGLWDLSCDASASPCLYFFSRFRSLSSRSLEVVWTIVSSAGYCKILFLCGKKKDM